MGGDRAVVRVLDMPVPAGVRRGAAQHRPASACRGRIAMDRVNGCAVMVVMVPTGAVVMMARGMRVGTRQRGVAVDMRVVATGVVVEQHPGPGGDQGGGKEHQRRHCAGGMCTEPSHHVLGL